MIYILFYFHRLSPKDCGLGALARSLGTKPWPPRAQQADQQYQQQIQAQNAQLAQQQAAALQTRPGLPRHPSARSPESP